PGLTGAVTVRAWRRGRARRARRRLRASRGRRRARADAAQALSARADDPRPALRRRALPERDRGRSRPVADAGVTPASPCAGEALAARRARGRLTPRPAPRWPDRPPAARR